MAIEFVEGKAVACSGPIDKVIDFSVRIAGNIDEATQMGRGFVEAMDGDDGKSCFSAQ